MYGRSFCLPKCEIDGKWVCFLRVLCAQTQTENKKIELWTLDAICRIHLITCSPLNNYNHNITKLVQYRCHRAQALLYCFEHTHNSYQYINTFILHIHSCIRKYTIWNGKQKRVVELSSSVCITELMIKLTDWLKERKKEMKKRKKTKTK